MSDNSQEERILGQEAYIKMLEEYIIKLEECIGSVLSDISDIKDIQDGIRVKTNWYRCKIAQNPLQQRASGS